VNPERGIDLAIIPSIVDYGDIDESLSLEEAHAKLREVRAVIFFDFLTFSLCPLKIYGHVNQLLSQVVRSVLSIGAIPFIIGGGNDQSYPNAAALLDVYKENVGAVNIDAHLDVRPLKLGTGFL
jgi:arginase family enzyme